MKFTIPGVAAAIGLLLFLVLLRTALFPGTGEPILPLLTLLFISEFGFLLTGVGGVVSAKRVMAGERTPATLLLTILCGALSASFLAIGLSLWQGAQVS